MALTALELDELDLGCGKTCEEAVGSPATIGAETYPGDALVFAAVEHAAGAAAHVQVHELVAMVGKERDVLTWRDRQIDGAPDGEVGGIETLGLARAVGGVQLEMFFAAQVADDEQAFSVVEVAGQAVAHALLAAGLAHGALPAAHIEDLAAGGQRQGVVAGVQRKVVEEGLGVDKTAVKRGARGGVVDFNDRFGLGGDVEAVKIAGDGVDDGGVVGRRKTHVVADVVGVALQIVAGGQAGVEVTMALVVADEVDATASP